MPPVMAFNMGSLGFLTPFSFHDFKGQVTQVLEGMHTLNLRKLFILLQIIISTVNMCMNNHKKVG